jgi:hypothetical protein
MKRRSFIQTAAVAVTASARAPVVAADPKPKAGEFYELRAYFLKAGKQPTLDRYLGKAFIPTTKRYGIGPVGAFLEKGEKDQRTLYVLIVHPSAESVTSLSGRLAADEDYRKAAREYLTASPAEAICSRIDSSLLVPIEGMRKLVKPDTSKPRLLNLRIYESHNERAGKKKIEMFNKGELDIFRRVGLTPVFFGETVVGAAMPNLTYLLVFPDEAGRAAAWARFRADAEWQKLRAIPEYADKEIVSRITNKVLTPMPYSEI